MKNIIFDCDNTFGIPGCDVDDGLALIYLLGCDEADVLGITTTYGNNETEIVYDNTRRMLKDLGKETIPLRRGGDYAGDVNSEAAGYLAEMARCYSGELSILATGSLTNLYGAWKEDHAFFSHIKEIVLMGGITEPLFFAKKEMKELNFSCDPQATYKILTEGQNISVITGNNCLKVLFQKEGYEKWLCHKGNSVVQYIKAETDYWFHYNENEYGIEGYYNWDVIAAAYLMHPELFMGCPRDLNISAADLSRGYLRAGRETCSNCRVVLPQIQKPYEFQKHIYQTWIRAGERL